MTSKQHVLFWIFAMLILILLFSTSLNGLVLSFYFVSFLLPVIIGTSLCFNFVLVPKFLIAGKLGKFVLYFFYLLIVSVYLEMLVIILSFIVLADYQIEQLGKIAGDIYLLAIVMYLVVFGNGLIVVFKSLKGKEQRIAELEREKERDQLTYMTVRSDRKSVRLKIDNITFIESLSDYIKIHSKDKTIITKDKISNIQENLPAKFLRIHRSFIVNTDAVDFFSREYVKIGEEKFSVGRKYKQGVIDLL